MWRLLCYSNQRQFGICLLMVVALTGCDWDASTGGSSKSVEAADSGGAEGAGESGGTDSSDGSDGEPGGSGGGGTEPDTTPPLVRATSPEPDSVGATRAGPITAEFNEDMFASTVNDESFTLFRVGDTTPTPGAVSFNADTNTASFSPDAPMAMLASYTANLSTDITDLEGNALAEQHSWSFTAADGEWKTAVLIESSNSGSAREAQIALDANGRGIAVWEQFQDRRYRIWSNRYNGSAWSTPVVIGDDSGGGAAGPRVAMNASGQAFAVWQQDNGSVNNIWANGFNGGSWNGAALIQTDTASDARDPQIAITSDGKAMAVWAQFQATCHKVWARRFDGSSWGAPQPMRPVDNDGGATTCDSSPPQVAVDANGRALAVWAELNGTLTTIWANRFDGSSWGSPVQIQVNKTSDARTPRIAMTQAGDALVVWAETDGFRYNIWANRFAGGSWGTAERIETDNAGTAENPHIAIDADGRAIAVWQQSDGSVYNIVANRFASGSWGGAVVIDEDSGAARNPRVAIDGNGRALAVWEQVTDDEFEVWGNRFADGGWGEAERIEDADDSPASVPQVAFDGAGKALAVWHQFDGARHNAWANRFE